MKEMTLGRKIGNVIDYLQAGGELEIDGATYVWLDNYVTAVIDDVEYGIDGLAIKGVKISNGVESPHYMGQGDMPIRYFIELVENLSEEDFMQISASLVITDLNRKNNRD